jgi:hypothetical protein
MGKAYNTCIQQGRCGKTCSAFSVVSRLVADNPKPLDKEVRILRIRDPGFFFAKRKPGFLQKENLVLYKKEPGFCKRESVFLKTRNPVFCKRESSLGK